jgi:hypothetical protein
MDETEMLKAFNDLLTFIEENLLVMKNINEDIIIFLRTTQRLIDDEIAKRDFG